MEDVTKQPQLKPDGQPKNPDNIKPQDNLAQRPGKGPVSGVEKIIEAIERSPLLGEKFKKRLDLNRNIQIMAHGLEPNAKMGQIVEAYDRAYLEHLQSLAVSADPGIFERYTESTDDKPLSFRDRQAIVNMLVNPANQFYKTEKGEPVNLTEYLNDYYKPLGISVQIKFGNLEQEKVEGIENFFKRWDKGFLTDHLKKQEVAIPTIEITKGDRKINIPIIGADWDVTGVMRDSTTREKLGDFVGLKIVHDTRYASGVQSNLGFVVHELDHAIRASLSSEKGIEYAQDRIIFEGTAEMARHRFGETQSRFNTKSGFSYQNDIAFSAAVNAEGELTGIGKVEYTYASGLVLTEQMRSALGEAKFWKTTYDKEPNITEVELAQLRKKVVSELDKQKDEAGKFLVS